MSDCERRCEDSTSRQSDRWFFLVSCLKDLEQKASETGRLNMAMTPEELSERIENITKDYAGSVHDLYSAIGVLAVGDKLGWRVLRITLGRGTYSKYQKILDVDFKEAFPEEGVHARKSLGLGIVKKLNNFWNVVKGVEAIDPIKKKMLV